MKWAHRENTLRLTCAHRLLTTLVFALQATRSISGQTFWNPGDGQDFLSASADVAVSGGQPTCGGQLTLNCTIVFPQFAALYMPYRVAWYMKRQNETQWTRIANDTEVDIGYPSNKYAVTVRYPLNWERSIYYGLVINVTQLSTLSRGVYQPVTSLNSAASTYGGVKGDWAYK